MAINPVWSAIGFLMKLVVQPSAMWVPTISMGIWKVRPSVFHRRLRLATLAGWNQGTGINDEYNNVAKNFSLSQNYPTPFNPTTTIEFELPATSNVEINVYNLNGELVTKIIRSTLPAGIHHFVWNAETLLTGTYFIKMKAGDFVAIKKCVLLK